MPQSRRPRAESFPTKGAFMKRLLKIVAALVILLIAGLAALPFLLNANQFRPLLESKLTEALGREVKLGNLSLSVFSGQSLPAVHPSPKAQSSAPSRSCAPDL